MTRELRTAHFYIFAAIVLSIGAFFYVVILAAGQQTATTDFFGTAGALGVAVFLVLTGLGFQLSRILRQTDAARRIAETRADRAVEDDQAKSAFLAAASHELRMPLNAIIGFSDMMALKIFGPLGSPRYAEYARLIGSSGLSLLGALNDMIALSQLEAGQTEIECEPTNMTQALNQAVQMILPKARSRNVRLQVEIQKGGAVWCQASAQSLRHVIARVLDNAIKFSIDNSIVEIALIAGEKARLEIRDFGLGIEADQLDRLGRPFVQAKNEMIRNFPGLGLGLAISRSLMDAMGGTLKISSEEGIGTIVTLTLEPSSAPVQNKIAA